MNNFLDIYQLPFLKQDQINHLNSPISPDKIEAVVKSPNNNNKNKKSPGKNGFNGEFYKIFKEELILIHFKLFHKIETQGTLPN